MHHNLIVFDFDGTIIDSFTASYEANLKAVRECAGKDFTPESYQLYLSVFHGDWKRFYEELGVKDFGKAHKLYEKEFYSIGKFPLVEGVRETLAFLSGVRETAETRAPFGSDSLNFAIVSNTRTKEFIWNNLVNGGISKWFDKDDIFANESNNVDELIVLAMKENGSKPNEVIFAADSIDDIKTGTSLGCNCAAVAKKNSCYNTKDKLSEATKFHTFEDIRGLVQIWFNYFNMQAHEEEKRNSNPPMSK